MFLREKSDGQVQDERRPKTSYFFLPGKERDGLVEIIPRTLSIEHAKHGDVIEEGPVSPVYPNDVEAPLTVGSLAFNEWRHSALLPVSDIHPARRPGTRGSSIYSEDGRFEDCASSTHSQEGQQPGGPDTTKPARRRLRTRSLLSLAKRYSTHDDGVSFSSGDDCGGSTSILGKEDDALQVDDSSTESRDKKAVLPQRHPSRTGTVSSVSSPPTESRNSWDSTALPRLRDERYREVSPLPSASKRRSQEVASETWWRESSILSRDSVINPSTMETSPKPVRQGFPLGRRPSSCSWVTIGAVVNERTSISSDERESTESSVPRGRQRGRSLSVRETIERDAAAAALSSLVRMSSPSYDDIDPRQDGMQLPPLLLPELPDEQKLSFYARCGHFETDPELIRGGQELRGWCPDCSKLKRSKRTVVKRELKSMLKLRSIEE
ncbi:uncharacterized protein RCC_09827 [Ramularia collo-cygni]|uniref:Uncharacterized protein n=1 Tax=Ramularia collo-cygni TaxID=112498 RepID=A0A2D3VAX9_9PEZI|nr:uncharacterized protein RCC_09827 [Ramularia collo-cygni]CZT24110.1 uncharacterized protein RCC_09827 [Ramularia collo-cygni]